MVLNEIFYRKEASGRITYYNPADVELKRDDKGQRTGAVLRSDGKPVESDGIGTMSKSKNNGVDPQDLIEKYGADTARLYMMFASPPEDTLVWSDAGIEGPAGFLRRLWRAVHEHISGGIVPAYAGGELAPALRTIRFELHSTIAKVADDYGRRNKYNTVVASVMEFMNVLAKMADGDTVARSIRQEGLQAAVLMLSPIAPHICHALWQALKPGADVMREPWPKVDESALVQDEIELVLQVNGKLRGHMRAPKTAGREQLEQLALAHDAVTRFTNGQAVKKVVVVPGRLVNVVV
jgi:leucyl-tRNA synthetase